jgi:hypothetical protein
MAAKVSGGLGRELSLKENWPPNSIGDKSLAKTKAEIKRVRDKVDKKAIKKNIIGVLFNLPLW